MPNLDHILPTAKECMQKLTMASMEEAARQAAKSKQAEAEKKALIDQLKAPSGLSDEEGLDRAVKKIEQAISNGKTEIEVYHFPNQLCTDCGRAINQQEPGWEKTLTGVPSEIYQLWDKYFRPRGYKLKAQIISFPDGMPGDVSMTLKWD